LGGFAGVSPADIDKEYPGSRIRGSAREDLGHDSDLQIDQPLDQPRAIDNKRLMKGPLAQLDNESMRRVGEPLLELPDLNAIL
jgi:hypothetical protein